MSLTTGTGPLARPSRGRLNADLWSVAPERACSCTRSRNGSAGCWTRAPEGDLRRELFEPSTTVTVCPYKGVASYEHVTVAGRRYEDVAWCYREPLLEALPTAGHRSFDGKGVEVEAST